MFGEQPEKALQLALQDHSSDAFAAANQLRERGLIPAVQDATFEVHEGELFVIMGLSGSGKSTLIRCISHLLKATAGEILIDGEDILRAPKARLTELRRHKLGMVFQHFGLFPHMTVAENVGFPLKMQGKGKAERRQRALEVVELVGLGGREDAYPRELSGGQRQRVGIARSLAVNPDVWFLDEPFSAIDPITREEIYGHFEALRQQESVSTLLVTHDLREAVRLSQFLVFMGDGQILQHGETAAVVEAPATESIKRLIETQL